MVPKTEGLKTLWFSAGCELTLGWTAEVRWRSEKLSTRSSFRWLATRSHAR